jgi:hypothetical protein
MEIKNECGCGQPFEFDVEPENGLMPCEIKCPACHADATPLANAYIAETLAAAAVSSPTVTSTPPPPTEPAAGLRINRPPTSPAPAPIAPLPVASSVSTMSAAVTPQKEEREGDGFLKGVAGALIAALVGMFAWYMLIKITGYEIGYAAWGVGALTGFGARLLGASGSTKLGVLAGLFAFIAIIGGQYLVVRNIATAEFDKVGMASYQEQLDSANEALKLQADDEIKAFIAKQDEIKVAEVSVDRLKEFRETNLPKYRDFAAGKPSKAEFLSQIKGLMNSWSLQFEMFKESFSLFTLLWIFLGVGSAYKLGSGAHD